MAALSVIARRLPAHSCDASFASSARSSLCTSGSRSVVVVVGGRWPHSSSKRSVVLGGGKSAAAEATAATARRLRVSCGSAVDTHADWGGRGYSTELPPMGVLRRRRRGVRCTAEASTGGGGVEGVVGSVGDAKGESEREGSAELAGEMEGAGDKIAAYLNEVLKVWEPPKFMWRTLYTLLLLGLVVKRVIWQRKLNMQQTLQQIARVGPETLGVSMLTSAFVGMVFTIQFCQEFSKVGLTRVIGGLLGLAFSRELTPVICAIVMAGRVGSAIAAELGTMQVSEQVDQLRTLGSDPVDYLVAPRVVACALSLPILSVISFTIGMAASILLADLRYGISPNAIVESAAKYLETSDIGVMCAKGLAFGGVIATISCGWGQTTTGGAKGVGESTTASVVISLVAIFVVDFVLSLIFFNK